MQYMEKYDVMIPRIVKASKTPENNKHLFLSAYCIDDVHMRSRLNKPCCDCVPYSITQTFGVPPAWQIRQFSWWQNCYGLPTKNCCGHMGGCIQSLFIELIKYYGAFTIWDVCYFSHWKTDICMLGLGILPHTWIRTWTRSEKSESK